MTYENIKTVALTILVVISGVLTWSLWTFQPNLEPVKNANYVKEVELSEKKEVKKIVKPDKIIYHSQGRDYGTASSTEIDKVIDEISGWSLYDIKELNTNFKSFTDLYRKKNSVEVIFPDEVPVDIYRNVLSFEDKNLPKFDFNRIIIYADKLQKADGTVYFVSTLKKQVFFSQVNAAFLNEFIDNFFQMSYKHDRYFSYETAGTQTIYLPEQPMEMYRYKYYPNPLDSEKFKDALFKNPNFVQKSFISDGEEYTDFSSKLTVDYNNNMIFYVNPPSEGEYTAGVNNILQKSIDFVNGHSGWTDAFRFVEMNEQKQKVTFRIYSREGYPIFNEIGMSEIVQVWEHTELNRYLRPRFNLELPLSQSAKTMPSGGAALDYLQKTTDFKPELLQDFALGYHMRKDPDDSALILLEPSWFYRYNNQWRQLIMDKTGGQKSGLE